jgi:SAM-dependent methyltransferase
MAHSYTTDGMSVGRAAKAAWLQLRSLMRQSLHLPDQVRSRLSALESFRKSVETLTGLSLADLDVLEIGHGQTQFAAAYVASLGNRVVGIDLDAVPNGVFDLPGYLETLRANGLLRAAKSWTRDVIGLNRRMRREFIRQRGLCSWPKYRTVRADASNTPFSDCNFDFVYSFYVLEHVAEPAAVLEEVARLLRPGGGFWFRFPHFCHYNALHDLRWITQASSAPRPWAHLLEAERHTVRQGAFVNTLRVNDWRQLFDRVFPDAVCQMVPVKSEKLLTALGDIRRQGQLSEFTDEELLTNDLIYTWRKR